MTEIIVKPFGKKAHDFIMRRPQDDKRYTVLEGSVRSSKTMATVVKTIVQYSNWDVPGKRFIGGVSKDSVMRNMLLDLFSIAGRDAYSYNLATGELFLFGRQYFVVGGRDEAAYKKILGATIGLFIGDEIVEFPKSFLSQVWLRMSPDQARFVGTTNPGNPYCYLKSEVLDNPAFKPDLEDIHFELSDNPNISKRAKDAIIASQVGVYALRYVKGLWVCAEGSIYKDSWDDKLNTCTNKTEPIALKNAGGYVEHWYAIDPGVDHPQATYEFYDDGTTIFITDEDVWDSKKRQHQRTDAEYGTALETFMGKANLGCQVILPPEAASYRAELTSRGLWVTDADNSVKEGIHTISSLMSRRNLVVNKDKCLRLYKSIPNYVWDEKAARRGEEEPLKLNDDEVDAMRYGIHGHLPAWRAQGGA
jgi:PBSX family phage terminase large subunit